MASVSSTDRIGPVLEETNEPSEDLPGLLVLGGSHVELILPSSCQRSEIPAFSPFGYAASIHPSGNVLVTGGKHLGEAESSSWLLDPDTLRLANDGLPPPHPATRRHSHASALLGDTNFLIGGSDIQSGRRLQSCCALRDSVWRSVPPLPKGNGWTSAAVSGDRLFVLDSGFAPTEFLRLELDRWTVLPTPPSRHFYKNSLAATDTALFALDRNADTLPRLCVYRQDTGTWSQGPQLLHMASFLSQCGGRLLALDHYSSLIQVYEPRTESWAVCKKERQSTDENKLDACIALS